MAKQKKQEEAAEQLHNQDDVDFEHIKELMGPPPLEASSKDIADSSEPSESSETKLNNGATTVTAPPLDPTALSEQFAENLSVAAGDTSHTSVLGGKDEDIENTEPNGDLESINTELIEATQSLAKRPSKAETPNTGLVSSEDFDDPEISPSTTDDELDKVVDEIIAQESDEVLDASDEKLEKETKEPKTSIGKRLKNAWSWWWHNPRTLWLSIFIFIASLVALAIIPKTRYFILNTSGVRVRASVRVLDSSTQQPLKNVEVSLAGSTTKTGRDGGANFEGLRLGQTELVIKKRAFAQQRNSVTLGWGSNPLGETRMVVTGTVYQLKIIDHFSLKPIKNIEVSSSEFSAISNEDGKVSLAIDIVAEENLEATIDHSDYRQEKILLDNVEEKEIKLVPRQPHVFVSKRTGKYDLYKVDADGKNEKLILDGTGKERDDLYLVPHISEQFVAYVSTRDGQRNSDGYLLSSLYIVNTNTGDKTRIVLTERVQIVGWYKKQIIYVAITEGTSANNPNRQKIYSYDIDSEEKKELTSANYFNDVLLVGDQLYYAPSSALTEGGSEVGLYKIDINSNSKQRVFDKEVWNAFRVDYDRLNLSVQQDWYELKLDSTSLTKLAGIPANILSRDYISSANNISSLWIDERDGKGVLLRYDSHNKKDEVLTQRSGIRYPISWLNDQTFVFRVADGNEVADYVMSIDGGEPVKLRDVTNTGSIDHTGY